MDTPNKQRLRELQTIFRAGPFTYIDWLTDQEPTPVSPVALEAFAYIVLAFAAAIIGIGGLFLL